MSVAEKLAEFAAQNEIGPVELVSLAQALKNKYIEEKTNATIEANKRYVGRCFRNVYYDDKIEYIKVVSHLSETEGWVTGLSFMRDIEIDATSGCSENVWFSFSDIYIDVYAPSSLDEATEISEAEYAKEMHGYIDRLLCAEWKINDWKE